MATITQRDDKWQAKVRRNGQQASGTFSRKTDADAWARKVEGEMERGEWYDMGEADKTSLIDALDRYEKAKTLSKKSANREKVRIKSLKANLKFANTRLSKITSSNISSFVDHERSRGLADSSIRLDLALLSNLFTVARKEWDMPGLRNPVKEITQPKPSNARTRRLAGDEETKLLDAIKKAMPRTPCASALVTLAIETGMRQSELLGLERKDINGRVAHLADTKSGLPRDVPLSKKAVETIAALPSSIDIDGKLFGVTQDRLVRGFAKACKGAGIEDLSFHDLRHEAASRLAKLYQAHELAKIFGWKTIQMAMRYYHPDVHDFVSRMDQAATIS